MLIKIPPSCIWRRSPKGSYDLWVQEKHYWKVATPLAIRMSKFLLSVRHFTITMQLQWLTTTTPRISNTLTILWIPIMLKMTLLIRQIRPNLVSRAALINKYRIQNQISMGLIILRLILLIRFMRNNLIARKSIKQIPTKRNSSD